MTEKMTFVEKMLAIVEECEVGLKRRAEGRFRPKSLCFAIDPRMVIEVRGWFDDMTPSQDSVERFDATFHNLGEYVRLTFTPHLDGSVYVTANELARARALSEQCKAIAESQAPAPVFMQDVGSSAEASYA
ncbi:MAG: hypothetical protein H7Z43_04250 [Clostridia bacterium]|nr:hypothetical protein [Deltaproteobacteria bacterium]